MSKPRHVPAQAVELEIDGKVHRGRYQVEKRMLTVTSEYGDQEVAMLYPGSHTARLAEVMFRDLIGKHLVVKKAKK